MIIDLGPNQSRALEEAAPEFGSVFAVVCRQSHPGDPSRYRLHLIPASVVDATKAIAVAKGEMVAKPRRNKE